MEPLTPTSKDGPKSWSSHPIPYNGRTEDHEDPQCHGATPLRSSQSTGPCSRSVFRPRFISRMKL